MSFQLNKRSQEVLGLNPVTLFDKPITFGKTNHSNIPRHHQGPQHPP